MDKILMRIFLPMGISILLALGIWLSYPLDTILRDAKKQGQAVITADIASGRVYASTHFYGNLWKVSPMFPKPTPPPVFPNQIPPSLPVPQIQPLPSTPAPTPESQPRKK